MSNQKLVEKKIGSGPKPSIGSELNDPIIERRSFISWITFAWITFAAALGGLLTMPLRLFFPNVLFEPPQSFKIGVPSDYEIDVVDLRWQDKFGTWIIRNTEGITKIRGKWVDIEINKKQYPTLPTFHPAFLLRQPGQKKYSWEDLKSLKKKVDS